MKKREAKWQTIWNNYVLESKTYGYFELKQTTTDRISIKAVRPDQVQRLLGVQREGLMWKLSDEDSRIKPLDSFFTPPQTVYVVVHFPTCFCMIAINKWIAIPSKSITVDEAKTLADKIIHTKKPR